MNKRVTLKKDKVVKKPSLFERFLGKSEERTEVQKIIFTVSFLSVFLISIYVFGEIGIYFINIYLLPYCEMYIDYTLLDKFVYGVLLLFGGLFPLVLILNAIHCIVNELFSRKQTTIHRYNTITPKGVR